MHDSKLFSLLKILSRKEKGRLGFFLASPYHNTNTLVVELYTYLAQHSSKSNNSKLSKITVFKHLFGDKEYDDLRMRRLMSLLMKLIEKFLAFEELELPENELYRKKLLIKNLGKKTDYRKFRKEVDAQIKKKNAVRFKSIEDYADLTWLLQELYFHPNTKTFTTKTIVSILNNLLDNQDKYICFSKLLYGVELQTRHRILNEDYSVNFLEEAVNVSQKYKDEARRFGILRALIVPIGDHQQHLKSINAYTDFFLSFYQEKSERIPESDFLLNGLINHYKSLNGDTSSILFRLFRFGIDEQILIENNTIRGILFSNIAILGSSIGEFDWTLNFIQKYSAYLNPKDKESTLNLSYAFYYFHFGIRNNSPKHFSYAQTSISQITSHFIQKDLRVRSLQLRLYYEFEVLYKGNISILLDNANSFKSFLNRNDELSTGTKEAYYNLIKLVVLLAKIRTEADTDKAKSKLRTLCGRLGSVKNIALKNWFLEAFERVKSQMLKDERALI